MKKKRPESKHTKILLALLALSSLSSLLYIGLNSKTETQTETVVVQKNQKASYPVQYSDNHITENAIVSNPKFKNIAFSDKESMLANSISNLIKSKGPRVSTESEKGTWLWTPILQITPSYMKSIMAGARKNNVRNIYLSIDSYLDIYIMPDGEEKDKKKKAFDAIIENFIVEANKVGMTVDAEAGWRNWAESGHAYKAVATLNYAIEFNKKHRNKLRGFQYDVEPYLLAEYNKDKKEVLKNFLTLIDKSISKLDKSDLELSVVIPEFYDGTNGDTPEFVYKGKKGYTVDHLLSILDRRKQSKIIVMSYRNWSIGDDGSIEISRNEIDSANLHETKIVVAQETGDVEPPYVTFHKTTKPYYNRQVEAIQKTFKAEKSFGGIAVHYINALMDLK